MSNYYTLEILPIILNRFKVNDILISGELDDETNNAISRYVEGNDAKISLVSNDILEKDSENNLSLTQLSDFNNYDAIFLNNDPNWYTVYNTLNLINNHNINFPLVFICNNVFPHKRRDSYGDPMKIPVEFRKEYSKEFNCANINIQDGFFHAIEENTSKNGVLTAIEDFLSENKSIQIIDVKLINGITILYFNDSISYIRLGKLNDEIVNYSVNIDDFSDNIIENKLLIDNIGEFHSSFTDLEKLDELKNELNKKEKIINDYEYQIKIHDDELNYKLSQIDNFESKLNLKDAQINNVESKLLNRENELEKLYAQIKLLENEVNRNQCNIVDNQVESFKKQLNDKELLLNSIKREYINQLSKIDTKEYCITCFKEELDNNRLEIQYLKNESLTKKFLSPFAYLYLIFKSKPKEFHLNYKLYNAIKNSDCFDIGYYLNNNKDILDSKWCKYFSPELHFVCNGFNEERKFNKKYYNLNSKEEFLKYLQNCDN